MGVYMQHTKSYCSSFVIRKNISKVAPQFHGQMHPSTYIDGKHLLVYMFITKIIKY